MSEAETSTSWERPTTEPLLLDNRTVDDIADWRELTDRVFQVAAVNDWTKAEVARRCGLNPGTFGPWFSGKYRGRLDTHNKTVAQWLSQLDEAAALMPIIPQSPSFIVTKTAAEIFETLSWSQATSDLVIISLAAGLGKTATCKYYSTTRPHVFMATISPHTKTVHGMLVELAAVLDVAEHNPAKLVRAIGNRLSRIGSGTLLIIDEAQNLVDDAINQLRHFVDMYGCGVALVGNKEVYTRFTKKTDGPSYAQLKRRIGKRMQREKPRLEDVQALIDAWGVTDPDAAKLLLGIGMKPGAMGQIDKTMKLAIMLSLGKNEELNAVHVETAWKNRNVEDLA